jgi:translation initiation factor 1
MSKKKRVNVVYSTNQDYNYDYDDQEVESIDNDKQELKVMIDRKQRKGKSVTLVTGFIGNDDDLKDLAKSLKSKCGVGGTVKNGEILIQGEFKEKIYDILINAGYKQTKKVGG